MNNLGRGSENNKNDKDKILTRETVGIVLELFALLTFVIMVTRSIIFGGVGLAISSFLLGTFGYCTYALLAALVYLGFVLITGKKLAVSGKTVGLCVLCFVFLVCLVHTITASAAGIGYGGYGEYLSDCYNAGFGGSEGSEYAFSTAGGMLFGLVVYPVVKLTTAIGGYIIFSLLTVGSVYLLVASRRRAAKKNEKQRSQASASVDYATGDTSGAYDWNYAPTGEPYSAPQSDPNAASQQFTQAQQTAQEPEPDPVDRSKRLFSVGEEFDFKSRREMRQESRRAEEDRRAAEQAPQPPLSPYAQGHAILYGDRPASSYMNGFSGGNTANRTDSDASAWYNAHMGGASSRTSSHSSSRSSSRSAEVPGGNSYTQNRIFDENSYFNRRGRSGISAEQYQNYFRSEPTPLSEGHERKSRTETPAPKAEPPRQEQSAAEAAPSSYTQQYQDEAEANITYSNRPKKIVTDTTSGVSETAPAAKDERDYYRNDVSPETGEGLVSSRPVSSFTGAAENFTGTESAPKTPEPTVRPVVPPQPSSPAPARDQAVHIDVQNTARLAGFGSMETRPSAPARAAREQTGADEPRRSVQEPRAESLSPRESQPAVRPSESAPNAAEQGSGFTPREADGGLSRRFAEESPRVNPVSQDRSVGRFASEPTQEPRVADVSADRASRIPSQEPRVADATDRASRIPPQERPAAPSEPFAGGEKAEDFQVGEDKTESALRSVSGELDTAVNLFDDDEEEPEESSVPEAFERTSRSRSSSSSEPARRAPMPEPAPPKEEAPRPKHIYARYNPPSLNFLREYPSLSGSMNAEEVEQNKETIVETLAALKIPCEVEKITRGPSVTRYEINIPGNIPTSRVLGCNNELAMRLHAKDGINVQINYESGLISIEVPNEKKETVGLKDMLLAPSFVNAKPGSLMFGIGKDIEGRAICEDIVKMTHLLVAGATNSGKSVCLHALIVSLLYKYSPEELRLILIDPKQNEFIVYDKLPHLMVNEIISNDSAKVITVLNWSITEMERRYSLFQEKYKKSGTFVRNIDDFNSNLTPEEERLPKIVIIIDELADLMSVAKKDIEDRIQRLTQKSRAAGIHLVLATQRPSVNVITGVIKSNLPTRIALKVTQEVDSRTILDESGAENLLGYGDLLYRTPSMTFPRRVQGAYVTNEEIQSIVSYIKEHNEAYFDDSVADYINNEKGGAVGGGSDDDSVEAVYIDALRKSVQAGHTSISMIQRSCGVGYPKAGKIIEWMERMGYITAFDGAKMRNVLLTQEEFDSKYGEYGE